MVQPLAMKPPSLWSYLSQFPVHPSEIFSSRIKSLNLLSGFSLPYMQLSGFQNTYCAKMTDLCAKVRKQITGYPLSSDITWHTILFLNQTTVQSTWKFNYKERLNYCWVIVKLGSIGIYSYTKASRKAETLFTDLWDHTHTASGPDRYCHGWRNWKG